MSRLLLRWVVNAVAIWFAAQIVPGVGVENEVTGLFLVALVFGLINALIRPIVNVLTCLLNILTLGLFTFVVNALMLMLTAYFIPGRLELDGFFSAFLAGIVISIVSTLLTWFLPDERESRKNRR